MKPIEIRRLRGALGMRQDQMGALLGLSTATISRWETARSGLKPSEWQRGLLIAIRAGIRSRPDLIDGAVGLLESGLPALALCVLGAGGLVSEALPTRPAVAARWRPRVRRASK